MDLELDSIYEGLVEYYVEDRIIFEGFLKRDFMEVTGVLTEAEDRNFLQKIWDKVIQIVTSIGRKISVILDTVTIKLDERKLKKLMDKFEKLEERGSYESVSYKSMKYNKYYIINKNPLDNIISEVEKEIYTMDAIYKLDNATIRSDLKTVNEKLKKAHSEIWKEKFTGNFNDVIATKDLKDKMNKYLSQAIKFKNFKKSKLKQYDDLRKLAKQKQSEAKKAKSEDEIRSAKKALESISLLTRIDFSKIRFIIKEYKSMFKNEYKLMKKVGFYLITHLKQTLADTVDDNWDDIIKDMDKMFEDMGFDFEEAEN